MKRYGLLLIGLLGVLHAGLPARAQVDPEGYDAAAYLLKQTTQSYRDGRHNVLLRALRQLEDEQLKPLYSALSSSKYPAQRVHGMLGLAEVSPARRLDLATLAEVENQREVVEVLSAAMDDDLIDNAGLATVLRWEAISLAVKQAIALRLLGEGGSVDPAAFTESLDVELSQDLEAGKMMQYALGALVLAETGDTKGKSALDAIGKLSGTTAEAVLAQVIDGAMRRKLKAGGPLALTMARDNTRGTSLRMLSIQAALRLGTPGALKAWQSMFRMEGEPARKIRLALIAMDASSSADAALFDVLTRSDDELLRRIGQAGLANANNADDLSSAFTPLLNSGQPLVAQWVVTYCRRDKPSQAPALLEAVIRSHASGETRNRARLAEAAIAATAALCKLDPKQANKRLPALLDSAGKDAPDGTTALQLRQIVLLGIARARNAELQSLARMITTDDYKDFTTEALRLLVRARYQAPLTKPEWARISDLVQGVGQMDAGLRIQLAWLYLKHTGQTGKAIAQAVR